MCYTTAQEAGLKGQTMQDPWLPHVVPVRHGPRGPQLFSGSTGRE